jgi:hypothetical protein
MLTGTWPGQSASGWGRSSCTGSALTTSTPTTGGSSPSVSFRHYAGVIDAKDQEAAVLLFSLLLPELSPG